MKMKMARLRVSLLLFADEVRELILFLSFFEIHGFCVVGGAG